MRSSNETGLPLSSSAIASPTLSLAARASTLYGIAKNPFLMLFNSAARVLEHFAVHDSSLLEFRCFGFRVSHLTRKLLAIYA
jgi:hypothetical protein